MTEDEQAPLLRVVRGTPNDGELAALTAVVVAAAAPHRVPAPRRRASWAAPARTLAVPLPYGPGGWRSSALPR